MMPTDISWNDVCYLTSAGHIWSICYWSHICAKQTSYAWNL